MKRRLIGSGSFIQDCMQRIKLRQRGSNNAAGKAGRRTRFGIRLLPLILMLLLLNGPNAFALDTNTLPTGGQITAGSGSISRSGGKMTVTQTTGRMITDWSTFNIGSNASVNFAQPGSSSVALNRIYDQNPSLIYGSLMANGQVFLVNNAGIYFGATAQVNVGGLVASSLNITKENFMAGNNLFEKSGAAGSIINQGSIRTSSGGYIAFISPVIGNEGSLTATGGTVGMAAGDRVSLDFTGDSLVNFTVEKGAVDALIENKGLINADGGAVILSAKAADSLTKAVVNNSGIIEAKTMENRSGRILLLSDMESGKVIAGGTLDASAPDGGNGGFIETSAAQVTIKDGLSVSTAAPDGQTGIWLIDPNDFTIAASGSGLTGGDMTGAQVTAALASSNLTIISNDGATSGSGDIFVNDSITWSANKLSLYAYRNIEINSELTGSGTAGLALYYGQGATDGVINGATASYSVNAPVHLTTTGSFSTQRGTSGTLKNYTIITSLGSEGSTTATDLQGMQGNLAGYYALGADIDASATSGWNSSAGFAPVGNSSTKFTGVFDGLGHTITGLTINRPATSYVGLFGYAYGADILNVGLTGGSVTGSSYVGSFAGRSESAAITNSYNTGNVMGSGSYVGGLAGYYYGNDSHTASAYNSYNTGDVTGSVNYVGGLVGYLSANGDAGEVYSSYNTGSVTGGSYVGGLAGRLGGTQIYDSYNTGSVSGGSYVGGLVGYNVNTISKSYSTGSVTGSTYVGGLVGYNYSNIVACYWDVETSGQTTASGGYSVGTGLTTSQMKQSSNFSGWDLTGTWRIYDGYSYPLLKAFLTPLTVTANAASRTYDGSAYSGGNGVTYSTTPSGLLLGTLTYGGTAQNAKNAGTYAITPGGFYSTSQQGYNIIYVDGTLTINPASLTVTANDAASRTYDATAYSGGNGVTYAGFVGGETSTVLLGTLSYTGTSQGARNAGSYVISPGGLASGNYSINYANGTLTINPATLTIAGSSAANKVYDGTTTAAVTAGTLSGLVGTETLTVNSTGIFDTKNIGTGKTVATTYALADGTGLAANYTLAVSGENLSADITARNLTAAYTGTSKTYDGTTAVTVTVSSSDIVSGDTVTFSQSAAFADKNAGTGKTINISGISVSGTDAANYSLTGTTATATADITKAALTVTANSELAAYSGFPYSGGNGVYYTGLIGSDTPAALGGSLRYAGSSQGAYITGTYSINPYGLTSGNYDISFVPGVLIIGPDARAYTELVESSQASKPGPVDTFAKFRNSGTGNAMIEGLISANLVSTGSETQKPMFANVPGLNNITVRIHQVDKEDRRKISGLIENFDGSGRHVPFRDVDELMVLLNQ